MNIRKWVYLFMTTLVIGGVVGCLFGMIFSWNVLVDGGFLNFIIGMIEFFGIGCMFSVFSQMGYFAYLTIHRFGMGMFGSFWNGILFVLTIFVLFDVFYLRQAAFHQPGESIWGYVIIPLLLFAIGLISAYWKAFETNRRAFMPALFFMVVVTTAEWYYPLKANEPASMWPAFAVLAVCNLWQLILLHRLIQSPKTSKAKA